MQKSLRFGHNRYEILGQKDRVLKFDSPSAALTFLRRFQHDPLQMATLRNLLSAHRHDMIRMKDPAVLQKAAELLATGKVRLLDRHVLIGGSSTETEAAAPNNGGQETATPAPAPAKKSWIEIQLIDTEGEPVPNERYRIKLPDGSVQEGRLDSFGYAEYYDINPGNCEVTFPDLDHGSWDRV